MEIEEGLKVQFKVRLFADRLIELCHVEEESRFGSFLFAPHQEFEDVICALGSLKHSARCLDEIVVTQVIFWLPDAIFDGPQCLRGRCPRGA